jgi:hypothetical protein
VSDWHKSSFSNSVGCVETRFVEGHVEMRNSKDPETVLTFTPHEWDCFLQGALNKEFNLE